MANFQAKTARGSLGYSLLITLSMCVPTTNDQTTANDYLPSPLRLTSGVVNKYYYHVHPGDGKDAFTDISYHTYQLNDTGALEIRYFDAGLDHTRTRWLTRTDSGWVLVRETSFLADDTLQTTIHQPTFINWGKTPAVLERTRTYPWGELHIREQRQAVNDTSVQTYGAKVFQTSGYGRSVRQRDTLETHWTDKEIYATELGLYKAWGTYDSGEQYHDELVEQMPLAEFERRAAHERHRVAYIDPDSTVDDATSFRPCGPEQNIADYYNGTPDGRFAKGKHVMLSRIFAQVDTTLLGSESGYLTFRFVVNCQGQAGRFVTEQANLNFQTKQFDERTVKHLYDIVYGLKEWGPTMIRGEARDAYYYLTFRLVNGKITDILP